MRRRKGGAILELGSANPKEVLEVVLNLVDRWNRIILGML